MKLNMGAADRVIRLVVVAVIAALYFTGQVTGTAAIILAVIGILLLVTSLVGWCPSYLPFGISTRKNETAR